MVKSKPCLSLRKVSQEDWYSRLRTQRKKQCCPDVMKQKLAMPALHVSAQFREYNERFDVVFTVSLTSVHCSTLTSAARGKALTFSGGSIMGNL